jgi:hypothetical protein
MAVAVGQVAISLAVGLISPEVLVVAVLENIMLRELQELQTQAVAVVEPV